MFNCEVHSCEPAMNVIAAAIGLHRVSLQVKVKAAFLHHSARIGVNFALDQRELKLLPSRTVLS